VKRKARQQNDPPKKKKHTEREKMADGSGEQKTRRAGRGTSETYAKSTVVEGLSRRCRRRHHAATTVRKGNPAQVKKKGRNPEGKEDPP